MDFDGLRIALIGPLPPPAGGMANQTRQLSELLRGERAGVELVQTNAPYRPAWMGGVKGLRALFRLAPYLAALWRAAGRCDVMHVMANSGWSWHLFAAPAVWIGWLRGAPVIVNYRGGEAGEFLERSPRLLAFTLRRAKRLLVPSGFLEMVFARHHITTQVLANIIDLQRFHPAAVPRLVAAGPHLVVARNLEALYDNVTALRAFALVRARHPGARLTIAGTGPELAMLRTLAQTLGVAEAVTFAGRVEREDMAALYRECDVSLNPSLADNMPNSVLESLASGVPVVSTDVGGVPFLVQHEATALLVPPGDASAMAEAVLRLLDDIAMRERLVAAGLAEVQRYTWARVGPALAAAYRGVMQPDSTLLPLGR